MLLQISKAASIDLVRQMVQAHAYWRLKGLAVDLVIWNEDHDVYRQQLQEQILGLIAAGVEAHFVERPGGGIFVRHAEQISNEDRLLFESVGARNHLRFARNAGRTGRPPCSARGARAALDADAYLSTRAATGAYCR